MDTGHDRWRWYGRAMPIHDLTYGTTIHCTMEQTIVAVVEVLGSGVVISLQTGMLGYSCKGSSMTAFAGQCRNTLPGSRWKSHRSSRPKLPRVRAESERVRTTMPMVRAICFAAVISTHS
nr:hypothetical protein CFP56_44428 [Quercus suber]